MQAREASDLSAEVSARLCEINQQLVLATLRAQELAEEAETARAILAESERRFRSLVTRTAAIIWNADAAGNLRPDAARWSDVTGLDSTCPGFDWLEGVHEEDRARVRETWQAAIMARTVFECEFRLQKRDGGLLWVSSRGVPLPGDGAPVRDWIGIMTDISDRKRTDEARERFISMLGHDLRTPLTAIKLSARTLEEYDVPPAQHARMLQLISKCSGRMERMITDVLDFARGRLAGGIPIVCDKTDFAQICGNAIAELQLVHPSRTIMLECKGDLAGEWDADRASQTVSNLVCNAMLHGVGIVRVRAYGEADAVVLEVHNYGVPIPAESMGRLFEPFRRSIHDGSANGLGLGLYIASEIVHAHGGTISAHSSFEEGTTFSCVWPRRPPATAGRAQKVRGVPVRPQAVMASVVCAAEPCSEAKPERAAGAAPAASVTSAVRWPAAAAAPR